MIAAAVCIAAVFCIFFAYSVFVYEQSLKRAVTAEPRIRTVSEFSGLRVRTCTFTSDRGQKLAGYAYYKDGLVPHGVVIISHGLGPGGQCIYMDVADYFTSHGYLAFAYDATAMDRSEGNSAHGLPQGVIDLQYAIDYVKHDSVMGKYPVVLFGHSWGGYAVAAVLNVHPDVKAVISVSGFSRTETLLKPCYSSFGILRGLIISDTRLFEKMRFGKYADYSGIGGFARTDAGILIIQSSDDQNVPVSAGYDLYYGKFKDNPRFAFRLYENKGHLFIYYSDEAVAYDRMRMPEDRVGLTEYGLSHPFDKKKGYEIDKKLFADMLHFCDTYCLR